VSDTRSAKATVAIFTFGPVVRHGRSPCLDAGAGWLGRRRRRKLRRAAIPPRKALDKDQARHYEWFAILTQEFERHRLEVKEKMDRTDRASKKHGFPSNDSHGDWQLVDPESPAYFWRGFSAAAWQGYTARD